MKIKRTELLEALKAVQPGTSSNETIQQSCSFVFDNDRIFTYNDEISVSTPFKLGITASVPAKEFQALINKLKGEDVTIESDGSELRIASGKSNAGLRMEEEIKLPLEELGMAEDWITLPADFDKAVKECLFSCGKDQTKYLLTHVHVKGDYAESSDGYRATRYTMEKVEKDTFETPLLIPAGAAKYVVTYRPCEYAFTDGWIHFRNDADEIFSCRWPEGETFPDLDTLFSISGESLTLPEELIGMMERGKVLAEGNRISVILEKNTLIIATENQSGWFEEEAPMVYKGKALEFDTYPEFLSSILKMKAKTEVSDKVLKFETDDLVHVVALLPPQKRGK